LKYKTSGAAANGAKEKLEELKVNLSSEN